MGRVYACFCRGLTVKLELGVQTLQVYSSAQPTGQCCIRKIKMAFDGVLLCCLQNTHHFYFCCVQKKLQRGLKVQ